MGIACKLIRIQMRWNYFPTKVHLFQSWRSLRTEGKMNKELAGRAISFSQRGWRNSTTRSDQSQRVMVLKKISSGRPCRWFVLKSLENCKILNLNQDVCHGRGRNLRLLKQDRRTFQLEAGLNKDTARPLGRITKEWAGPGADNCSLLCNFLVSIRA